MDDLTERLVSFVRENPNKYTVRDLIKKFGFNRDIVRGRLYRAGLMDSVILEQGGHPLHRPKPEVNKTVHQLSDEAKLESSLRVKDKELKELTRKYRILQDEFSKTQTSLGEALEISSRVPVITKINSPPLSGEKGQSTVVCCLSDVHCDELVPKNKVNGLNEHNPDISSRRVMKFFELVLRFLRVDRQETQIDNLILWWGGDFFSSDAHGVPTAFPPMTAAMYAQDLLASGLIFLQEQEPNLKIHIVGSVGNHSRKDMAKPVNQALEQEHSLEWMMYHALKNRYASDNVTFQLENSYHSYLKIYNKTLRFNHGHLGWRYNDGMGGVHGPLWKVISQKWDKQIKADLTICGHYHTYTPSSLSRGYLLNGSVIGITPYSLHFGYEPPAQTYFLVNSKYGIVGQRPLFVDI